MDGGSSAGRNSIAAIVWVSVAQNAVLRLLILRHRRRANRIFQGKQKGQKTHTVSLLSKVRLTAGLQKTVDVGDNSQQQRQQQQQQQQHQQLRPPRRYPRATVLSYSGQVLLALLVVALLYALLHYTVGNHRDTVFRLRLLTGYSLVFVLLPASFILPDGRIRSFAAKWAKGKMGCAAYALYSASAGSSRRNRVGVL